jgi:hypothetical protein
MMSAAMIVTAFAAASLAVWYTPTVLAPFGLAEFAFLGQLSVTILALSVLEVLFTLLSKTSAGESHIR